MKTISLIVEIEIEDEQLEVTEPLTTLLGKFEDKALSLGWTIHDARMEDN